MSTELAPVFEFATELASTTDDVIEAWLAGRNALTRRGYLSDLGQFALWAKAPSPHAAVDALLRMGPGKANQIVIKYRAYMIEVVLEDGTVGLSSSTINRRLAAIRSMVKFGRLIGVITWALDVPNVEQERRKDMSGPDQGDVKNLFRAAADMGEGKQAIRDRAIIALIYDLDLRRAECCGLDLGDVEMDRDGQPRSVRITGKGKKEKQRLTLPEVTGRALAEWIHSRGAEPGPLFHRCDGHQVDPGRRLTGESIRRLVGRIGQAAGIRSANRTKEGFCVRPHGLRHAATTDALAAGRPVQDVQKFGRWATLQMVLRYEDERGDVAGEVAALVSRRRQDKGKRRS